MGSYRPRPPGPRPTPIPSPKARGDEADQLADALEEVLRWTARPTIGAEEFELAFARARTLLDAYRKGR